MKKLVFLFIFLITSIISVQVSAQISSKLRDFFDEIERHNHTNSQPITTYDDVKGSPYVNETFMPGTITSSDGNIYKNVPLRYNAYDDWVEFKHENGVILTLSNSEKYKLIEIEKRKIIYGSYTLKKKMVSGYYELIQDGKIRLLKKHVIFFKEKEEPKPFVDPKPAQFIVKPSVFFIAKNDKAIQEVKSIKDLISSLNDKKEELAAFVKKEKIKSKKEENLIKIINYYNSL